jgi:hypothetical protein
MSGRWAYGSTSSLVLSSLEGRHSIISAQGVRQGNLMGPLKFSLGIRSLLKRPGFHPGMRGRQAHPGYFDDIYILSPDDLALDRTLNGGLAPQLI